MVGRLVRLWVTAVLGLVLVGAQEGPPSTQGSGQGGVQGSGRGSGQGGVQGGGRGVDQESPQGTTRPSTRRARVVGATSLPSFKALAAIPRPFAGTTRPGREAITEAAVTLGSLDELRSLERQVEETSRRVIPTVVCLQIGGGSGSGVIISPDGWVLTAGHVSGTPDQDVVVVLHDGRRVRGKTLGANRGVDSGLVRLVDPGPWPYTEIGESGLLKRGQWLMAIGHPGGYKIGRSPVVRLGRLVDASSEAAGKANDGKIDTLTTDNTLVGGDSGGPLFDLEGRVVGIHSRIDPSNVTMNKHVPADVFVRDWDRIAMGEEWGNLDGEGRGNARVPWFGATYQSVGGNQGVKVAELTPGSPADKAGLRAGDVIYKIDDVEVKNAIEFQAVLIKRKSGDVLAFEIRREGAEDQVIKVKLGDPQAQRGRRPNRNR